MDNNMDNLAALETLRTRGDRRLTGVETIRAARILELKLDLMAGTCWTVGTSQEGTPRCERVATFRAGRVAYCEGCARYHLHGTAARLRGEKLFPADQPGQVTP